jgi:hypothetical protein
VHHGHLLAYFQILSSVIYFHILWKKLTHCPNSLGEVDNRFQLHLECHPTNLVAHHPTNLVEASDKSTYTIKSSIYSYPNNINICKCQTGYEFSPFISREELSKNGKQENSFMVSLDLAGKKFQCVIPKDNTKPSTAAWVIPVSLFYAIAGGLALGEVDNRFQLHLECHPTNLVAHHPTNLVAHQPTNLVV